MNIDSYQEQARHYRLPSSNEAYALLNLTAEVGEVMGKVAKHLRDGGRYAALRQDIKKELGDVMWMVCAVADDFALPMSELCQGNLDKLSDRKQRSVVSGSGDNR